MKEILTIWFVFLSWGPPDGSNVRGEQAGPFFSAHECNAHWETVKDKLDKTHTTFTGCVIKWDGFARDAYKKWEAFYIRKHQFGGSR